MRLLRVFLSSTFLDFQWERDHLNTCVLPEINAALRERGLRIDLVDLRWGVSDEAGLDHAAVPVCLAEIERCCAGGAAPAFILMLGDREGWQPLPSPVEASWFERLLDALPADSDGGRLLRDWYRRDDNHLPPSWSLRTRRGTPEAEPARWAAVERQLGEAVAARADALPPGLVARFSTPVTRMEAERALALTGRHPGRVAAMRRREGAESGAGVLRRLFGGRARPAEDPGVQRLDGFWNELSQRLGDAAVELASRNGRDAGYRARFDAWARDCLLRVVPPDAEGEAAARAPDAGPGAAPGVPRRLEQRLLDWLAAPAPAVVLVHGRSGSGKSVLARRFRQLAAAAGPAQAVHLAEDGVAYDTSGFLQRLCACLALPAGDEAADRIGHLHAALGEAGRGLLVVDALEAVAWRDASEALAWLPDHPGAGTRVLLTTSSEAIVQAFLGLYPEQALVALDEMDDDESARQVEAVLAAGRRRVTPVQAAALLDATRGLPGRALANRMAAVVARGLAADAPAPVRPDGLRGWVRLWIEDLAEARGHGRPLVEALLALVVAARHRVSELDLFTTLARSDEVRRWFARAFPFAPPPPEGLPRTTFSRLVTELGDMLDMDAGDGELYFRSAHALLRDALADELGTERLAWAHRELAARGLDDPAGGVAGRTPSPYRLAETFYQLLRAGPGSRATLEALYADVAGLAAKTAPGQIGDTLQEIDLLQACNGWDSPLLLAACELLRQLGAQLRRLPAAAERADLLRQAIDADLASNPLRQAVLARGGEGPRIRQCLATPRLPGLVRIEADLCRAHTRILAFDDELAMVQEDGSIAIVGARHGEVRRRLPGHRDGAGGRAGAAVDAMPLPGRRLLSCGRDGDVALSSIPAGRDVLRLSTGDGPLLRVDRLADGTLMACGRGDGGGVLHRWRADGTRSGRIDVAAGTLPCMTLDADGPREGSAIRADLTLPWLNQAGNRLFAAFQSQFVAVDGDHVLTAGMGATALWSFRTGAPVLAFSTLSGFALAPKLVLRSRHQVLLATNGGGLLRLDPRDGRVEVLRAGTESGGADLLDGTRLFAWTTAPDGRLCITLMDAASGEPLARFDADPPGHAAATYFRGSGSNVFRGVLAMDGHLLAWSGYGCERIDPGEGRVRALAQWGFDQYTTQAIAIDGQRALLLQGGRPVVFDSAEGAATYDLSGYTGHLEELEALGDGRVLARPSHGSPFYWDVRASLHWIDRHDLSELARQPQGASDALLLPGDHLLARHRPRASAVTRFGLWQADERPMAQAAEITGVEIVDGQGAGTTCAARFGPLLLLHGGGPAAFRLVAPPDHGLFEFRGPSAAPLRHVLPLFDADGGTPQAVAGMLVSDGTGLEVVAIENGLSWPLPPPDDQPLLGFARLAGGVVLVATGRALWRLDFDTLLPRDPRCTRLVGFDGRDDVEVLGLVHGDADPAGLLLARRRRVAGDKDSPRDTLVVAYELDGGTLDTLLQPQASQWTVVDDGIVLHPFDGADIAIRFDAGTGRIEPRAGAAGALAWPRRPLQRIGGSRHAGDSVGRAPLFESRPGLVVEARDDAGCLRFLADRIESGTARGVARWFADGGYEVLDFDPSDRRIVVRTRHDQRIQLLDARPGPSTPDPRRVSVIEQAKATVDPGLSRLLRRCGQPALAAAMAQHWLGMIQQGPSAHRAERFALVLLELAEAWIATGEVAPAGQALEDLGRLQAAVQAESGDDAGRWLAVAIARLAAAHAIASGRPGEALAHVQLQPGQVREPDQLRYRLALFLGAALPLLRADAACHARVLAAREALVRTLEGLGADAAAAGAGMLADLDWLLARCAPPPPPSPATVDWNALAGAAHGEALAHAQAGDGGACNRLGAAFGRGQSVERNPLFAAYWYQRGVELGDPQCAFNLSHMYRHGEGVVQDMARGFELLKLAAEGGITMAKCNLGNLLIRGEGCAPDPVQARHWLRQACAEGDTLAPVSLAVLLATGDGGPRDMAGARALLLPLARMGNPNAIALLARLDGTAE